MSLQVIIFIFQNDSFESKKEFKDQVQRFMQNLKDHLYVKNYGYYLCFEKFKKTILALKRLQQVSSDPKLSQFVQGYFFSPKYLSKMEFESKELRKEVIDFIGQREQFQYLIKEEHESKEYKAKHKDDYFHLLSKQTLELKGFDKQIYTPAMVFNIMSQFGKVKDVFFHQFYPYQCFVQFDDVNNQQKAKKSLNKMNLFGSQLEIRQVQERDNKFLILPKSENLLLENDQLDISFSNFPSKSLTLQTFYKKMNVPNINLLMDPFYRPKKIIEFQQNSLKSFLIIFKNKKQALETISIYDKLEIGKDYLHFFFVENNKSQLIKVINKKIIIF